MLKTRVSLSTLLAAALFTAPSCTTAPRNLTVDEHFVNPIGLHGNTPTLSWKLPDSVQKQTAYELQTTSNGNTQDSGWITSDQSSFVPFPADPLSSRQQVDWRVRFRDQNNKPSDWSPSAHFELGLLSNADWHAKWIHPAEPADIQAGGGEPVALLQRTFPITKPIAHARLYITARGLFELSLNNSPISDDHFTPGFTPYDKRIDTLTYDLTTRLHPGDNTLSALLARGWYAGRYPFSSKKKGPYGNTPALLAQLEITYTDGTTDTLTTDESWQATFTNPILSSSIYDGENDDARITPANFAPAIAEENLGPVTLTPKPFPPVRQTDTLTVQNITQPQPGHYIFDLGQNMVGWARIHLPLQKDQTLTLHFAEMLNADGTLYNANYRTAKATDSYTAAATGTIDWQPHFTFHGFRYVELTGLPANTTPQKDWITGIVLHTDLPTTALFTSSDPQLNQLQSNILWGWRGNSLDIPTDCPQRDERAGWTGDAEIFCPTSLFNTDALAFWKSWLSSMRDDQTKDGVIPDVIPGANIKVFKKSPGWMDAATIIPWDLYVRTGDTSVLADNYDMMQNLVAWYRSQSVDGLLPNIKGYGDWLQPYPQIKTDPKTRADARTGDTPFPLLGVAFYARSTQILADSARVLGKTDDAKKYDDEAANIRTAFTKQYFDANGKLQNAPETQTAYVLAIAFNLIPQNMKPKAADNLVRLVHDAGDHLGTGFLGTPFLCPALDQTGHPDLAATLLFQQTYPSWFYPINQGATTMWERWNSYTKDKGFGDVSMNSFNHYAYGAIGQWMYERIAGLAPDPNAPGYKHFFLRPLFIPQLSSATATLETPYGKASSAWQKSNNQISLTLTIPPNTTATLELPQQPRQTLTPRTHHIEVTP